MKKTTVRRAWSMGARMVEGTLLVAVLAVVVVSALAILGHSAA